VSELRKDPVVDRHVVIVPDRAWRLAEERLAMETPQAGPCPFCPGNEAMTAPELLALRNGFGPNQPGWRVRVVPNRFPALRVEGELRREGVGLFDKMSGLGAHEVIIDSPAHDEELADFDEPSIQDLLYATQERVRDLRRDIRFEHIVPFKNSGLAAGASLVHPHTQLIALPFVPRDIRDEIQGALRYYRFKERCVYCDIIRQEQTALERMVYENADFVAVTPFAPRFPFEVWILPRGHEPRFEDSRSAERGQLANALRTVLRQLRTALGRVAYNLVIHGAPLAGEPYPHYHWHVEILPRLLGVGGFEFGTGCHLNPMPPESAAQHLRDSLLSP
jgi:UDPglucose--hexose-1-phosphate uridylyltransferase